MLISPYFQDSNFRRQSPQLEVNCMCFAINRLGGNLKNLRLTSCGRERVEDVEVHFRGRKVHFRRCLGRVKTSGFGAVARVLVRYE